MGYFSVLFHNNDTIEIKDPPEISDSIKDLNIDQIIESITLYKQEYNLKPFFYFPLHDISLIKYRQEIMRDIENQDLFNALVSFAEGMIKVRKYLSNSNKYYYKLQKQRWLLDAAGLYCEYIQKLNGDLSEINLNSDGLNEFREYLKGYVTSSQFVSLVREIKNIQLNLSNVKYSLLIRDNTISVRNYSQEPNYQIEIEKTFAKFQQDSKKSYLYEFGYDNEMNHIEAAIIEYVSQIYPEVFNTLSSFSKAHQNFQDPTITIFDREIQFYISYLEYTRRFRKSGYHFCYPEMTREKNIFSKSCFDLALAKNLYNEKKRIIRNDFFLKDKER
ncbi:MAG: DNA mismatch repair protein MutS, partial [Ignavibacteria bacterium]|nr:DNA mismatch repair protein MutS [Ignavibacteria bacterium]